MNQEIRFHIEMETERLVREAGLDPQEGRRRALMTFGGVEKHKEALRDGRGTSWLTGGSLDLKLGLRMLAKYPGLSLVGILGMAVAVTIGAISFSVIQTVVDPTMPLPAGDRIFAIQNVDARTMDVARQTHLHDLVAWREALTDVRNLGAFRTIDRNLVTGDGRPESVRIAEMTASGFDLARVAPLMGRFFDERDEQVGAPPVAVIGYDWWQSHLAGERNVVGRTLRLGATDHTIVGVMPKGFAFPVNHRLWTPLRLDPSGFTHGQAPAVDVFGHLAPNVRLGEVEARLTIIGRRLATAYPATHESIRPRILPYARAFLERSDLTWTFHLAQVLITMLLVAIGTNVAILVYARTQTRMGEIAVRSALGASRGRIVAQISAEAMVLSAAAAMVGLVVGSFALRQIEAFLSRTGQLPFWMNFGVSPGMILYVAGLAALATVVVGVVPALRATRQQLHATLQQLGPGRSGMRLGRTWTVLIVAQVAIAVMTLPFAIAGVDQWVRHRLRGPGFAAEQFLTAQLHLDREGAAAEDPAKSRAEFPTRYAEVEAELVRRLEAQPGVEDAVLVSDLPVHDFVDAVRMEADFAADAAGHEMVGTASATYRVVMSRVDTGFFRAFDIPLLAGRRFEASDVSADATGVIVNRSFVEQLLGGADPLGRRVRRAARSSDASPNHVPAGPWYEIVGVVPDFPRPVKPKVLEPRLYHALVPGTTHPTFVIARVKGVPVETLTGRLRETAVAVDPLLRLESIGTLEDRLNQDAADQILILLVVAVSLSVVLLSAAGIYALMSYTISVRRRDIGIRSALGAASGTLLRGVLSRAAGQIATGIALGTALAGVMAQAMITGGLDRRDIALLIASAALMMGVGLLAAAGPARRALRIQPTEALKGE
jgi:predicted permease